MRVVNQRGETITDCDLTTGYLRVRKVIRPDAVPLGTEIPVEIDGETILKKKRFWYTEDYEEVQMYIPYREKTAAEKIAELKAQLSKTDYKVIKCSECQLLSKEMPYDVAALHAERQAIRDEINRLEQEA